MTIYRRGSRLADRGDKDLGMQAMKDTIAGLGQPMLVRALGAPAEPIAMIARWQHGPSVVDVRPSTTIRLTMRLVAARNARASGCLYAKAARAEGASVSIFSPAEGASVEITGKADVVQLFLDHAYVETILDAPIACPPMFDLRDDGMRNILMRILVGSARAGAEDALRMEENLQALALRIAEHADRRERRETPSTLFRGGLAPAACRRVDALIGSAIDGAGSPPLAEMAGAAGLSVTHFVRAFR